MTEQRGTIRVGGCWHDDAPCPFVGDDTEVAVCNLTRNKRGLAARQIETMPYAETPEWCPLRNGPITVAMKRKTST